LAFELKLPAPRDSQGWKAKIRDRERVEPPHVTIIHRTRSWRLGLRSGEFLDKEPDPRDVPDQVVAAIRGSILQLREKWDVTYPENPVSSEASIEPKTPKTKRKHK